MSEIWKPQSIEIYESWADAITNEALDKLSQWEFDFVVSIQIQLTNCRQLNQKQAEILERIYSEKTS